MQACMCVCALLSYDAPIHTKTVAQTATLPFMPNAATCVRSTSSNIHTHTYTISDHVAKHICVDRLAAIPICVDRHAAILWHGRLRPAQDRLDKTYIHVHTIHTCTLLTMLQHRCTDGHAAIDAKCRGLRRINVKTHKEDTLMPYLIGSSQPVFSPDGKYIYLASAANEVLTFSQLSGASFKPRETKTVPAGMYRVDIATSEIKLLALLSLERETATSVVITSDGKTLYYNNFHAVYGMHVDTGTVFVLCGNRDTFGKANGRAEDARLVSLYLMFFCWSLCTCTLYEFVGNKIISARRPRCQLDLVRYACTHV
jgi:hypothetical protein